MKKLFFAVMSVALLAACRDVPQPQDCASEDCIADERIENVVEDVDEVDFSEGYFCYFFEADSLLQKEIENIRQDTTVILDYAALIFKTDSIIHLKVLDAIDGMIFNLGKDSVETLIAHHNRVFLDSLENRLPNVEFEVYSLDVVPKENEF